MATSWAPWFSTTGSATCRGVWIHLRSSGCWITSRRCSSDHPSELVEDVRQRLALIPVSRHIYNRLVQSREAAALPSFNLSDTVGRDAPFVFVRTSGDPINSGVPGIYSYSGYHDHFVPGSRNLAELLTAESWVLGEHGRLPRQASEIDRLVEEVQDIYLADFRDAWKSFLADIDLVPFTSAQQAVK